MHNPLVQFVIKPILEIKLFGYDLSFTNSSLFMLLVTLSIIVLLFIASKQAQLIPSLTQTASESLYNLVNGILVSNAGAKGKEFLPIIFSLFMFILTCNLFGMVPYSFTVTSHISITFGLAIMIFLVITMTGFIRHGFKFFSLFLPKGTPLVLAPLIVVIELFSYLARPVSLSLRLAANMIAGHILLKIMAGFVIILGIILKPLPIPVIIALTGFEVFVAILQAYIFTVLSCVYLNDALNLH